MTAEYPDYQVGYGMYPARAPTPFFSLPGKICKRDAGLERRFPILGGINLNEEQDHLFGFRALRTRRVLIVNQHPGRRYISAVGGTARAPWIVLTRERYVESRDAASHLYRFTSEGWEQAEKSGRLGVDWPHAARFGEGLLIVERDRTGRARGKATQWRFKTVGTGRAAPILPVRSEAEGCSAERVTGLYTFDTGEVLTAGQTCRQELVIERWSSGGASPVAIVIPPIAADKLGYGLLEVVAPALVRVQLAEGRFIELRFDGEWHMSETMTPPRQALMLQQLEAFSAVFESRRAFVFGDQVFVAGNLKEPHNMHSVLLSNFPVEEPCLVDDGVAETGF